MIALPLLLHGLAGTARAATPELLVSWDFEADDGGFTQDEILPLWEHGEPLAGPTTAWDGLRCWGTNLAGDYINDNDAALILAPFDLDGALRPVLVLHHWLRVREGDLATLEIWDGSAWVPHEPVYGYPDGAAAFVGDTDDWEPVYVDLSGLPDASALRLVLRTDPSGVSLGWYVDGFAIYDGDVVPPHIDEVLAPEQWDRVSPGFTVQARVQDDVALAQVDLVYASSTGGTSRIAMAALGDGLYSATLPALAPDLIAWRIEASDGANLATWPELGAATTRIALPGPTDLATEEGRQWGTTVPLRWTAPVSEEALVGYHVYRNGEIVIDVGGVQVEAPAAGPEDRFVVTAAYDSEVGLVESLPSEELVVEIAVPEVQEIRPGEAYQGDLIRLEVTGEQLLLDATDPPVVDLGEGIEVGTVEVEHVDRAVLTVSVAAGATVGPRDLSLRTGGESLVLARAFEVLDGADRPSLLGLSPDGMDQGARGQIRIQVNTSLGEDLHVDMGEGVVIEGARLDGDEVLVDVAIANDASTGLRDLEVDDGLRILRLEDAFRVRVPGESGVGCVAAPGSGGAWSPWLLVPALALGGRLRARQRTRSR